MQTVFSHIIQKRLSQENENIATDALAFILNAHSSALDGLLKVLRGISPDIPNLHFRTQHTIENARPDMWGFDGDSPRVYIENKFWAGLTDNQPVKYLHHLSECQQPSILLFVVPEARQESVWRELIKRLGEAEITTSSTSDSIGIVRSVLTDSGSFLALTSWEKLLEIIESELSDDFDAVNDLHQLIALCGAANVNAFQPFSSEDLSDQRTPSLIFQIQDIVESAIEVAVTEKTIITEGLNKQINNERIGRYFFFPTVNDNGFGGWVGLHFNYWKQYGFSPIWLVFATTEWGRGLTANSIMKPWCNARNIPSAMENDFIMALDIPVNEEKDAVVRYVADRLKEIGNVFYDADTNTDHS